MVTFTLTIHSAPEGIQMSAFYLGQTQWFLTSGITPKVITVESGTVITVTAPDVCGEPVETDQKGFYFVNWTGDISGTPTARQQQVTVGANKVITANYEQQTYYPTRTPERRATKFEHKVASTDAGDVIASRITALKPMMVEQQAETSAQQERIETKVGKYLNDQGLYGTELHHYRNFSQELYGVSRLFTSATLDKEGSLRAQKWKDRGLLSSHLIAIGKLMGITITVV